MDRRAAYTREELEEIFDAENQQANLRYARPPHCSIGVESAELAHALAKRVLEERDEAIQRVAQLEAALQRSMGQAEKAMHERDEAAMEVVRGEHERDELEAELLLAHNLLADASYKNEALLRRVRQLEKWREVASQVLDSREVEPPPPPPAAVFCSGVSRPAAFEPAGRWRHRLLHRRGGRRHGHLRRWGRHPGGRR